MEGMRKFEEEKKRKEIERTIVAWEKEKSELAIIRMVETTRQLDEKEAQERRDPELRATIEAVERNKSQEELAYTHQEYKRYSIEEIQIAMERGVMVLSTFALCNIP